MCLRLDAASDVMMSCTLPVGVADEAALRVIDRVLVGERAGAMRGKPRAAIVPVRDDTRIGARWTNPQ